MSDEGEKEPLFSEEIYDIKNIFYEIIKGYSCDYAENLFIKHFTELDKIEIIRKRQELLAKAKGKGLRSQREVLDYLTLEKIWNQEDENRIAELELSIQDSCKMLTRLVFDNKKHGLSVKIKEMEDEVCALKERRTQLIGLTAEKYADEKYVNYFLFFSFYKDEALSERYFSKESFEDLEDEEVNKYFEIYTKNLNKFNPENFKKVAVTPVFLNLAGFAYEDSYLFLGKSVMEYTTHQFEVFSLLKRNMRVISETSADIVSIHSQTKYSDLIKWYNEQFSSIELKNSRASGRSEGGISVTHRDVVR